MALTSLAVSSSPSLAQSAMSPAATMTSPEGSLGGRSGAQPRTRRPPRSTTRTIEANLLLLLAFAAPSSSEAVAEQAATILTNIETAISLLVTGRRDTPKASPPRRRHLHTRDGLARCAVVRFLSVAVCQPGAPQSSVLTTGSSLSKRRGYSPISAPYYHPKVCGKPAALRAFFTEVTLLWSSCVAPGVDVGLVSPTCRQGTGAASDQHAVDLPGEVALEAADDLSLALALRGAPRDVLLGAQISAHPGQTGHVQRTVGLPVATAVETVPNDLAGGGFDGRDPAQIGEGRLASQSLRVIAGHNQEGRSAVGADARQSDQLRGHLRHQRAEVRV